MPRLALQRTTALITGASGGIGLELTKLFARDGYSLVLVARDAQKLQRLAENIHRDYQVRVDILACDLSERFAVQRIYEAVSQDGGQIDILVNNAGAVIHGEFSGTSLDEQLRMIELNISALTHLTRLFLPSMMHRRNGRILNVASVAAFQPGPLMSVYSASKAYVLSFSEAIAEELRGSGVTVTALCPGLISSGTQSQAGTNTARASRLRTVDAATIACLGYRGMLCGRRVVIGGLLNQAWVAAVRFAPRWLVTRIVRRIKASAL